MASPAVASPAVPIRRLSFEDVLAMFRAEILDEHERVELIEGVLYAMNPIGVGHEDATRWLVRYFAREAGLEVKVEHTFLTGVLQPLLDAPPLALGALFGRS